MNSKDIRKGLEEAAEKMNFAAFFLAEGQARTALEYIEDLETRLARFENAIPEHPERGGG